MADTVRKKNVSGEDLEVSALGYEIVKNGDEVDLPKYYPWHTTDDPAEVVYPEAQWADVTTSKKKTSTTTDSQE